MTYSTSSGTDSGSFRGGCASRRTLLGLALVGLLAAPAPAVGHTPYRQWKVYRQRHLMLGASRDQEGSYPAAKALQAFLEEALPEARARVARARTRRRLGDLLATDQIPIILLSPHDAVGLTEGQAPFREPIPDLRVLAHIADYVLCVRSTFPEEHAWILTHALTDHGKAGDPNTLPVPVHKGTLAALAGEPAPVNRDNQNTGTGVPEDPVSHQH